MTQKVLARTTALFALSLTLSFSPAQTPSATVPPATLTIQVDKPLHSVSPTLYGLMTEEINFSYDGGLYAEMVRNRTLQENGWDGIAHWTLVEGPGASAHMSVDKATGPSAALPKSLLLDITRATPAAPAGARNEGFWGMSLTPNTTYRGSFYAKADPTFLTPASAAPASAALTFALISNNTGKAEARTTSAPLTSTWKRYEFTLKTSALTPSTENHLEITATHPGKLWITLISLFPPTFHDRPNGNRIDLMQKLAAMHPRFLRLPGGNYLEGDTIAERFDWKRTIGPLVDRPTHRSPWNYQSSDGLGLLEFLNWTEDLRIDPVLAVYAGYSLKGAHVDPGPALQPFVDDALDEIEFVTGDPHSTHWGAIRASLGHPAPFPLHYVEIGNEDEFDKSGSYEGRYAQFSAAVKAKYPALELIATTPIHGTRPDLIDDHYYRSATEFFGMLDHYDHASRTGPKIFVGEWATREGSPTTNLGAALGDAAFMTSLERNSDLIVMASYAPLLVNVNPGGMQWESDLIGYDTRTSFGSPSFYAQSIFAEFLGTEVPTSTIAPPTSQTGTPLVYSVTQTPAPAQGRARLYLKLVNATSAPAPLTIVLSGTKSVAPTATLITLSGASPAQTNTLSAPTRIVPIKSTLGKIAATFPHTVPPYSIQVLTLEVK